MDACGSGISPSAAGDPWKNKRIMRSFVLKEDSYLTRERQCGSKDYQPFDCIMMKQTQRFYLRFKLYDMRRKRSVDCQTGTDGSKFNTIDNLLVH